jgi:hypothetical protein
MTYTPTTSRVPGYRIDVGYSFIERAWKSRYADVDSAGQVRSALRGVLGNYPTRESAIDAAVACIAMLD